MALNGLFVVTLQISLPHPNRSVRERLVSLVLTFCPVVSSLSLHLQQSFTLSSLLQPNLDEKNGFVCSSPFSLRPSSLTGVGVPIFLSFMRQCRWGMVFHQISLESGGLVWNRVSFIENRVA